MADQVYGYEELPGSAIGTPGVEEILRRRERGTRKGVFALGAEAALLCLVLLVVGPSTATAVTAVLLAPIVLVTAALTLLWHRARLKERRIMTAYPWQVWRCRVRGTRVVAAEGQRQGGRRWGTEQRVVLLRSDGSSQCSFPPPEQGWEGPHQGVPDEERDRVWFAGDTRFGGILAAPGGLPFRYVTRTRPHLRRGSTAADAAARRAGLLPRGLR
ncbi:hypothetical protein [Streptomyces sp. NPDC047097]|uniref:hypothetical protein n=1 Tax=Streptomyces sp. NPDC047097 TaxID=3155260 RepID=UPI0033D910F2